MEYPKRRRLWTVTELLGGCLLYVLLHYLLSCWLISFQHHPLFILLFAGEITMLERFWGFLFRLLGRWPALAMLAGCLLINIMLLWGIGYFPVSTTPLP